MIAFDVLKQEFYKRVEGEWTLGCVDVRTLSWGEAPSKANEDWHNKNNPDWHVKGAKVAFVLLRPYPLFKNRKAKGRARLASIGRYVDYHVEIEAALEVLKDLISHQQEGHFDYKYFVDKHGFDDRKIAHGAGLTFWGKHNLLIHESYGSAFNIGYVLTSLEVDVTPPLKKTSRCGDCMKCVSGCPNSALKQGHGLNTHLCRAALNQGKGVFKIEEIPLVSDWIYGCDICQWLCPFNHTRWLEENLQIDLHDVLSLSNKEFKNKYGNRAFAYLGASKLKRNALVILFQQEGPGALKPYYDQLKHVPMLKEQMDKLLNL